MEEEDDLFRDATLDEIRAVQEPVTIEEDSGDDLFRDATETEIEQAQQLLVGVGDTATYKNDKTTYEKQQQPAFTRETVARSPLIYREFNEAVQGAHTKDWDDEKAIDNYMEIVRAYGIGHSPTSYTLWSTINNASEEDLRKIGRGLALYENETSSALGLDVPLADNLQTLGDYGEAMLKDPLNWVSLYAGKILLYGGTKLFTSQATKHALKEAAKTGGIKTVAGKKTADKVMTKAFGSAMKTSLKQEGVDIGTRTAAAGTWKQATKEAAISIAFDTAVNVGTETAYQQGLLMTGVTDEMQWDNVGLAALGTLVIGGLSLGVGKMGGKSGFDPNKGLPTYTQDVAETLDNIAEIAPKFTINRGDKWAEKVARGVDIEDLPAEYWFQTLQTAVKSFKQKGFVWIKNYEDENIGNFVANQFKNADPVDAKKFLQKFEKNTGIKLRDYSKETLDDFADNFAHFISTSAKTMQQLSTLARTQGKNVEDLQIDEALPYLLEQGLGLVEGSPMAKALSAASKEPGIAKKTVKALYNGVVPVQRQVIRLIVSNPATTALNVSGYSQAAAMNSATDTVKAVLYRVGSWSPEWLMEAGNKAELARRSKVLSDMQFQRARNLLDPTTTIDMFKAQAMADPDGFKQLMSVLTGGVEEADKMFRAAGIDPNATLVGENAKAVVDWIQRFSMVQAQDIWSKSQEFNYQFDKNLRLNLGKRLNEIWGDADFAKRMATDKKLSAAYTKAQQDALYETERAIYSKSYKNVDNGLSIPLTFFERMKDVPGFGLLAPFGRFFNSVLATSSDLTGVSYFAKVAGLNNTPRSATDLAIRAGIFYGTVGTLAVKEREYIEQGLGTFDREGHIGGQIIDERWNFPFSLYKGLARVMAYRSLDQEPPEGVWEHLENSLNVADTITELYYGGQPLPPELLSEVGEHAIGQLLRDLGDSVSDVKSITREFLAQRNGQGAIPKDVMDGLQEIGGKLISAPASGATRFLEPANTILGLLKGRDFKTMDRKDGSKMINDSFRYMDHIVEAFGGDKYFPTSEVERFDTAKGKIPINASKFTGSRTTRLTETERMLNLGGVKGWTLNAFSDSPEANNEFNLFFHSVLEEKAKEIVPLQQEVKNVEKRNLLARDAIKEARDAVISTMKNVTTDHPWKGYEMLIRLQKDKRAFDRAFDTIRTEAGLPELEVEDLDLEQLELIEGLMKFHDDYLRETMSP